MKTAKSAALDRREARGAARGIASWYGRGRTFLIEVRNEVKRVTWPSMKEVQATTLVVILTSVLFGLYLWGADLVLDRVARTLFTVFGAS